MFLSVLSSIYIQNCVCSESDFIAMQKWSLTACMISAKYYEHDVILRRYDRLQFSDHIVFFALVNIHILSNGANLQYNAEV